MIYWVLIEFCRNKWGIIVRHGTGDGYPRVAYFCMEFGLHETLPIYAGGLGILAGDYLKAARDLGLPVVGIGIFWRQGYTRQTIGADGRPYDLYPETPLDKLSDTGIRIRVEICGCPVICRVYSVDAYGNSPLYLLDACLPGNPRPELTQRLYGGTHEDRLAQEIILGVGGVRALRALGMKIDVYHFNEGHAVLAGLELIREKIEAGLDFEQAWRATREEVVFTTHTPVAAGNEVHDLYAVRHALGNETPLTVEQMAAIGGEPFNMTVAGLRLSRMTNAVSQQHCVTANSMWANVKGASPIIAITNGVHQGTWQDPVIRAAFTGGDDLLAPHQENKLALLEKVRALTGVSLNPNGLLVGFARRAAGYKRGDLIFRRPELIEAFLAAGRLQLVLAGKAHPADNQGKDIIARLVMMARRYPGVVFLENYDISLGRALTRGCDLWLNNPLPPMEASGTSGMKAAMNGVLNLSILDGWWPEGCRHGINGWRIECRPDQADRDESDANALYDVLLREVLPVFENDKDRWHEMMRASIEMAERFSIARTLRDYYRHMYAKPDLEAATA